MKVQDGIGARPATELEPEHLVRRLSAVEALMFQQDQVRDFRGQTEDVDVKKGIIQSVISTDQTDHYGTVIAPGAFEASLVRFREHGVVLWLHGLDSFRGRKPVGNPTGGFPKYEGKGKATLRTRTLFDMEDNTGFSQELVRMYEQKKLSDWSVGFRIKKDGWSEDPIREDQTSITIWDADLTEYSAVHVGANPWAVTELTKALHAAMVGMFPIVDPGARGAAEDAEEEGRGALKPHSTKLAEETTPWRLSVAQVNDLPDEAFAWIDGDFLSGKSKDKRLRKLPHHHADMRCNWRGVAAAMAVLRGARGGAQIPTKDVVGVYRHLANHYKQFDKEAPAPPGQKSEDGTDPYVLDYQGKTPDEILAELAGQESGRAAEAEVRETHDVELAGMLTEVQEVLQKLERMNHEKATTRRAVDLVTKVMARASADQRRAR